MLIIASYIVAVAAIEYFFSLWYLRGANRMWCGMLCTVAIGVVSAAYAYHQGPTQSLARTYLVLFACVAGMCAITMELLRVNGVKSAGGVLLINLAVIVLAGGIMHG